MIASVVIGERNSVEKSSKGLSAKAPIKESPLLSIFQVCKKGIGPLQTFCACGNTASTWSAVSWACSQRLSCVECGAELA